MSGALVAIADLLVRSGLVAGLALVAAGAGRWGPPRRRVAILRAGVCLLLALPVMMAAGPGLPLELLPAEPPATSPTPVWTGELGPVRGVAVEATVSPPSLTTLAGWLWAAGALLVIGRLALGVWTLHRWTRAADVVVAPAWTSVLARLGGPRPPRLLVADPASAPLSWGLPPGVVLVGPECLRRPEAARAVLAHELAHIRHGDWLFLLLSRLALALFWFNPLVWKLHADLVARTEEAADAAALVEVPPADYARTLVSLAAGAGHPAALAMAGPAPTLARRIACIMKTHPASPARPLAAALTVAGLVAVATPIAAVELTPRAPEPPQAPAAPPAPPALPALAPLAPPAPPAPPVARAPAPPAPPQPSHGSEGIGAAERAEIRAAAEQARAHAAEARAHAAAAREAALAHAAEARAHGQAAAAAGERARAEAEVHAAAAHRAAARAMAEARVEMARGAGEMMEGARTMRTEGERLRDPAYRAEQIARARARGDRVPTDAELLDLSRRLPQQADELEAQARRLREQAAEIG
ncbi:MAG: M56 family metallopeptidase [Brevundimonas sp.]|uniref:M56 family metallopeptidase n=1 Tax=Brevundimonas sp. TaxID=1871086 RepID=UPI0017D44B35|nr:M56 family metallopeptidase [Brevundimonas sp.]MBA4804250.1 M56 family metallopeptidase [Brevundimonas sp.]